MAIHFYHNMSMYKKVARQLLKGKETLGFIRVHANWVSANLGAATVMQTSKWHRCKCLTISPEDRQNCTLLLTLWRLPYIGSHVA